MFPVNGVYSLFLSSFLCVTAITFSLDAMRSLYSSEMQYPIEQKSSQFSTLSPIKLLKNSVVPLKGLHDSAAIIKLIAQRPYVLIGDSTHGTYEFYQQRINLSKQLIQEKNFRLIVLEGDLPNIHVLNQYIHSLIPISALQALNVSNPQGNWLWGNLPMLNFIQWLKRYNEQLPESEPKVSLSGMDIYSFDRSRELVINYLQSFSPQAAQQARQRYQCFNRFNNNLHRYGKAVAHNPLLSCEAEVVEQYKDFSQCRFPCPEQYPFVDREAFFYAMQNARIAKNTEKSFRIQYLTGNDMDSWNQRDLHMMESFLAVYAHLNKPKTIIWAHNSHLGDARATEMAEKSGLNLGQLMRQHFKQEMFAIGMLTYSGTVSAADDWNQPAEVKRLLNAHPMSNEALFHRLGIRHFVLYLHQSPELAQLLSKRRLQRHVGVVYRPDDELDSHYSYTHLSDQFDAVIYIDVTTALTSLSDVVN
ncbi:MAG: erythromycin esterase family protein [Gammaproteobacteria bacterium]|nr:erythromycin esterase family protein [Gammaproteobacteria bacterium]